MEARRAWGGRCFPVSGCGSRIVPGDRVEPVNVTTREVRERYVRVFHVEGAVAEASFAPFTHVRVAGTRPFSSGTRPAMVALG